MVVVAGEDHAAAEDLRHASRHPFWSCSSNTRQLTCDDVLRLYKPGHASSSFSYSPIIFTTTTMQSVIRTNASRTMASSMRSARVVRPSPRRYRRRRAVADTDPMTTGKT